MQNSEVVFLYLNIKLTCLQRILRLSKSLKHWTVGLYLYYIFFLYKMNRLSIMIYKNVENRSIRKTSVATLSHRQKPLF